ncbi:MAG: hypothetical protein IJP90_03165, partial [Treponema sp.]|nr:hypothetical protein [Treponema sp.]
SHIIRINHLKDNMGNNLDSHIIRINHLKDNMGNNLDSHIINLLLKVNLDNNQEYIFNLEDVVEFQSFYFRKKTKNIELTIKEVYKGEKWDDTCITALIPANIYSFGDEDKSQPFEQSYTYKRDKNEVFENIEQIKKSYERISHENDSGDGK